MVRVRRNWRPLCQRVQHRSHWEHDSWNKGTRLAGPFSRWFERSLDSWRRLNWWPNKRKAREQPCNRRLIRWLRSPWLTMWIERSAGRSVDGRQLGFFNKRRRLDRLSKRKPHRAAKLHLTRWIHSLESLRSGSKLSCGHAASDHHRSCCLRHRQRTCGQYLWSERIQYQDSYHWLLHLWRVSSG